MNFNRNSNNFIQENALENVVCEMASIFSRSQCGNISLTTDLLGCINIVLGLLSQDLVNPRSDNIWAQNTKD